MSMCLYIKSGPERDLARLAQDGDALAGLTLPASNDLAGAARELSAGAFSADALEGQVEKLQRELRKRGWRGRIVAWLMSLQLRREHARVRAQLERMAQPGAPSGAEPPLDLHKSWHTLHYLLTGTAWDGSTPGNTLLAGGREVGEDLGYGPARVVSAGQTADFDRFLNPLTTGVLESRIDLPAMARLEIYCASDGEGGEEELRDDVDHYFPLLKAYVSEAASRRHGLAIWMM